MSNKKLYEFLSKFATQERIEIIEKISQLRTEYVTVALEDIYSSQNGSALLRTCECFGINSIHVIENENEYSVHPKIVRGADKWLNLTYYNKKENNTIDAINSLKAQGYRIVATTPHDNDVELEKFNIDAGPFALFFGTEQDGISQQIKDHADEFLKIPMYGFTESFNISVSAGIILQNVISRLHKSSIQWQLDEKAKKSLRLEWLKRSLKNPDLLEERFLTIT